MFLDRLYDDRLAQASYLVGCEHTGVALVVDPLRDPARYLAAAAARRVRITHVTETHIHADYMSGSRELAARTGAQLLLSDGGDAEWKYGFAEQARAELLTDGSHFLVGDVKVEAVHTPGHTPEHMTFMITDTASASEPMGALTGDFIFVGDVGRPDLLERAAGFAGTMEAGARTLFRSLRSFANNPDYLQIWPGHGAGSACGKALGAMPQSTLGYEKLFNWALMETDEERFVEQVLSGQPEPPAYFARMKHANRDGPPDLPTIAPATIDATGLMTALAEGRTIVDTRSAAAFAERHVRGTINVPRNKAFLNWVGALLPYDEGVLFLAPADEASKRSLIADLALIGFDTVGGVFPESDLDKLFPAGAEAESTLTAGADEMRGNAVVVLDIRGRSEYAEGHVPGAVNIPLAELERRIDEVPGGALAVHCQGGTRSAIATSVLMRHGRRNVSNVVGGFPEWERSGYPVERGPEGGIRG